MEYETKDIGRCPNVKPHRGRGSTRAKGKGSRCLNTCFSNNQNLIHDSVAINLLAKHCMGVIFEFLNKKINHFQRSTVVHILLLNH